MSKVIDSDKCPKSVVLALHECQDLCRNGYSVMFDSYDDGLFFVKLRHYKNGSIVILKATEHMFTLLKDGKIRKCEDL